MQGRGGAAGGRGLRGTAGPPGRSAFTADFPHHIYDVPRVLK